MKKLLITLPCYNEASVLEKSVKIILDHAQNNLFNYDWKILIIDNISTDNTFSLAQKLSNQDRRIMVAQCLIPGRGAALRAVWQQYIENTDFDIYTYMDIDLATDLKDFKNLISQIENGYDISVGSRYVFGADVKRSLKRKILSKLYNLLLKIIFRVKFKDAQCGFKALKKEALMVLLPLAHDNGWFWDSELMIIAERKDIRIAEIPVSWRETRDELRESKVSALVEVLRQLKNIYMLRRKLNKYG